MPRPAGVGEHHADVHAEPEPSSGIRDFHPDLGGASPRIHLGIDVAHPAAKDPPGIGGRGNRHLGSDADRREVLLIEIPHEPDRAEIGDDK